MLCECAIGKLRRSLGCWAFKAKLVWSCLLLLNGQRLVRISAGPRGKPVLALSE